MSANTEDPVKFELYQSEEDWNKAEQLFCIECGCDKFYIGRGNYFTVMKCIKCHSEESIHRG